MHHVQSYFYFRHDEGMQQEGTDKSAAIYLKASLLDVIELRGLLLLPDDERHQKNLEHEGNNRLLEKLSSLLNVAVLAKHELSEAKAIYTLRKFELPVLLNIAVVC